MTAVEFKDLLISETQPAVHLTGDPTACIYRTGERSVRMAGTWPYHTAWRWLEELARCGYAVDRKDLVTVT